MFFLEGIGVALVTPLATPLLHHMDYHVEFSCSASKGVGIKAQTPFG